MDAVLDITAVEASEPYQNRLKELSKRNQSLLNQYSNGKTMIELSQAFNISATRCYQIVNRYKHLIKIDRDREKNARLRRLKRVESLAPDDLAPRDATELVKVIEAQRKELEGDAQSGVINNIQMNIKGDINLLPASDKWTNLRSLLEQ